VGSDDEYKKVRKAANGSHRSNPRMRGVRGAGFLRLMQVQQPT
jgi:hypothetical protein